MVPLKILDLNCQCLNAKFSELSLFIEGVFDNNARPDTICLQETWISENHDVTLLQLPGYQLISKPCRSSLHGGVAMYVLEDMKYSIIQFPDSSLWDGLLIEI